MAFAVVAHRRLQDHRPAMPAGVVDQTLEDFEAQMALTQIGVTVLVRSAWVTGVIEMEAAGLVGAEEILSLLKERLVARLIVDGMTGGEGVTGIDAEAEISRALGPIDNYCKLLQSVADESSLSCGVLQEDPGVTFGAGSEDFVEGFRDAIDPLLFSSAQVGAGMHHESRDPQSVTAIQLVAEGRSRASEIVWIGRGEIHQIGGVSYQGRDLAIAELLLEPLHVGFCERFSLPLAGVLDEDLNGVAGQIGSSGDGSEDTACDGNMGTE